MASHKQLRLMRLPIGGLVLASLTLAASCLIPSSEAAVQKPGADDPDNIPKIDLLLSGGGLRASAFAYGVLAGLNEICVYASEKETKIAHREKDDQGELKNCEKGTPLLDQVNIISAVSGGAVTAAYFKTHREEFFEEFPKLLKKSNLQWRLLKAEKSPSWKRILRSPVFLLTSIWDTIGSVIGLPLSLLNLNIELTPIAVMALSDGLLESDQLTTVYKDVFYQNLRLEDLSEKNGFPVGALARTGESRSSPASPTLLINASDITNGTVFTFDERTFECMGARSERGNVELALAVAASSSLPGVFSPVRIDSVLKGADPLSIPTDCPPTLADRSRKPVLVDGGVTDNLGAIGLLRTVMRKKEELVGNGLSHDARKEKHLLLFINSEAESDAKLPGLAGYFDASYDVLIRSKKDLVRVMVSNMFQHFGFSTVELRMSDLVSSEPALKKLVAVDVQQPSDGRVAQVKAADLVPRAMDLTEKEQKIERTLDQIGMLPSSDEIDTLISMGKKIVSNRFEALDESFSSLRKMEFTDNCATIANPDKYWCWPDQFRANDLESGGGSAFLRTLDDVTSKFRTNAIQAREALFQEILLESAKNARQELRAFAGEKPEEKNKALLDFLRGLIKKPPQETELYNILVEAKISPEASAGCIQAFDDMKNRLQSTVEEWDNLSFDQTLIKLSDTLHEFLKATCFPEYHMIRFFPKILNLGSEKELNKNDLVQLTWLLHQGLNDVSPHIKPLILHHYLGIILSWYFESSAQGLTQFTIALELAQESTHTLQALLDTHWGRKEEHRSRILKLIGRSEFNEKVQQLHRAYVIVASPVPLAGKMSDVSDEEVHTWERRYLRDHEGNSLLDRLVIERLDEGLRIELGEQIDSLASIQVESREPLRESLCRLHMEITRTAHIPTLESCPPPRDIPQIFVIRSLVDRIREEIRLKLSKKAGMRGAREVLQSLYSEYKTYDKERRTSDQPSSSFDEIGPDILQTYGLLHLREAMQEVCPLRNRTVESATSLFDQAIEGYKNKDNTEDIIQSTRMYRGFVARLGCAQITSS